MYEGLMGVAKTDHMIIPSGNKTKWKLDQVEISRGGNKTKWKLYQLHIIDLMQYTPTE